MRHCRPQSLPGAVQPCRCRGGLNCAAKVARIGLLLQAATCCRALAASITQECTWYCADWVTNGQVSQWTRRLCDPTNVTDCIHSECKIDECTAIKTSREEVGQFVDWSRPETYLGWVGGICAFLFSCCICGFRHRHFWLRYYAREKDIGESTAIATHARWLNMEKFHGEDWADHSHEVDELGHYARKHPKDTVLHAKMISTNMQHTHGIPTRADGTNMLRVHLERAEEDRIARHNLAHQRELRSDAQRPPSGRDDGHSDAASDGQCKPQLDEGEKRKHHHQHHHKHPHHHQKQSQASPALSTVQEVDLEQGWSEKERDCGSLEVRVSADFPATGLDLPEDVGVSSATIRHLADRITELEGQPESVRNDEGGAAGLESLISELEGAVGSRSVAEAIRQLSSRISELEAESAGQSLDSSFALLSSSVVGTSVDPSEALGVGPSRFSEDSEGERLPRESALTSRGQLPPSLSPPLPASGGAVLVVDASHGASRAAVGVTGAAMPLQHIVVTPRRLVQVLQGLGLHPSLSEGPTPEQPSLERPGHISGEGEPKRMLPIAAQVCAHGDDVNDAEAEPKLDE
mmetsp:Transcript_71114/g.159748  ORF Transcript_71114/g.159748 Transcript_71114/m.159748 type:complete len:577 (+) Transcript_71114:47-1777(+)